MSILDDQDNGIENTLIDPFNMTISNEAYPFPVEEFIPTPPTPAPGTVDKAVIPALDESGAAQFHSDLKAELAQPDETAEEMTDTPQEPADAPAADGEVRISLEDEEDPEKLFEATPQEAEDVQLLESLVEVRDRLREMGGISQDDVYQVESIAPGIITDKISLNRFSSIPTRMGYDVSLESVGSKIVETVKKILAAIIDRLKRIFTWISKKAEDKVANTTGDDAKAAWKSVLALAAKVDSQKGTDSFKEKYGETEAGRKAGSTEQFIRMYAMSLFNKRVANFTVAQLKIQKGGMAHDVRGVLADLKTTTAFTNEAINKLKSGKSIGAPNGTEFDPKYSNLNQFREHIAALKAENATITKPATKLFENLVAAPDAGADARDALTTYGKKMGELSLELSRAQDAIANKTDDAMNSLKNVNAMIQAVTNELSETSMYVMYYGTYFSNCVKTCRDCKQVLRQVGGLHAIDD